MSAHFPSIHAPRWLREAARSGHRGHRASASRFRHAPRAPVLPVAAIVLASLLAGIVRAIGTEMPSHPSAVEASLTVPVPMDVGPQGMVQPASFVALPDTTTQASPS